MQKIHKYTSDYKTKKFGNGEWSEEPDEVNFLYRNVECCIERTFFGTDLPFPHEIGGHLCGYAKVANDHPYFERCYDGIEMDVHGGITYCKREADGLWIGFDCAHAGDLIPYFEFLRKTFAPLILEKYTELEGFRERFNSSANATVTVHYRNLDFCIGQCHSMVDQLLEAK